jgi:hypothetical protein
MPPTPEASLVPQKFFPHGVQNLSISLAQSCWDALERGAKPDASAGAQPIELRDIVSVRFGLP